MLLPSREMPAFPKDRDKGEKAMIARFDHRPILMTMALATVVCVLLVALTLFVAAQTVPSSGPSLNPNTHLSAVEMHRTMML
jgi:hypothetical protein